MSEVPPPTYGSADGNQYPPAGQATAPVVTEPPPKYEPPSAGPYAQQQAPGGYPSPQQPQGYDPQQGGYPAGYQGQPGTVHNTIIVTHQGFAAYPKQMECPNCHAFVTTALSHQAGGLTWLSAGLLCLFGCWMGCCLIPFCIDDLQDVEHRCPNCGRHLGTYRRI